MSNVVVQPVASRRQRKQFLQLPWELYRDDPNWIPPITSNAKEMAGLVPHPFYERNGLQTFLAYRDGEVCGRIAAILNRGHIHQHDDCRGFFGFFECIDDQQVAGGLFDAARQWLADQGIHRLRGPCNPSLNYELGLLIDGFHSPPTFMMTYNPPYYQELVENYGFRKTQDLYAYWGHRDMLPAIQTKLMPIAEQIIERYEVKIRPLDTSRFMQDVVEFLSIYNRSLVTTWGFVPMSESEVRHMAKGLQHLIVPELTTAVELDGKIVGAAFGLPDYNPRIRDIKGRLFPFGVLHLLRRKDLIKKIRLISANVLPEYQRLGLGLVLLHGIVPRVIDWDIQEAEFSWVLESNYLSRGSLEKGGAKLDKTYRLYDLDTLPDAEEAAAQKEDDSDRPTVPPMVPHAAPTVEGALEVSHLSGEQDWERFAEVPARIYTKDPQWVEPLAADVRRLLDPGHPFRQHGEAAQFLATRSGVALGRILVSDDDAYNQAHGTNVGCFGMFECVDDPEMAQGLLDAAADWLRGRGRDRIIGPIDYSTNYACGLLVEGFESPPVVGMNHHRPYYAELLKSWGLTKAKDLHAWWFTNANLLLEKWERRIKQLTGQGVAEVRPLDQGALDRDLKRCLAVYEEVAKTDPMVACPSEEELRQLIMPGPTLTAEVGGETMGLAVTHRDRNEALASLRNKDSMLARLWLKRRLRRVTTARLRVLCCPTVEKRQEVAELLILQSLVDGAKAGFTGMELSWVGEDDDQVGQAAKAAAGRHYKTYRVFEKSL